MERPSRLELAALFVVMMLMMPSVDFWVQKAFALSITEYAVGSSNMESIMRVGNKIVVVGSVVDTARVYNATGTLLNTITCTDCQGLVYNDNSERLYAYKTGTSGVIYEFSPDLTFMARSVSYSGNEVIAVGDYLYMASQANDRIDRVNVTSGTLTVENGNNINTGANACDAPVQLESDGTSLWVACNGATKYTVAIVPIDINGGEPEFRMSNPTNAVYSLTYDGSGTIPEVILSASAGVSVYAWYPLVPELADAIVISGVTSGIQNKVPLDSANRWYIADPNGLRIVDNTAPYPTIWQFGANQSPDSGSYAPVNVWNDTLIYVVRPSDAAIIYAIDTTGIDPGSGGGISTEPIGCVDGFTLVNFITGASCVPVGNDGIPDLTGENPLYPTDGTCCGLDDFDVTVSVLLGTDVTAGGLIATVMLALLFMTVIMVPAWKFGSSPPFFVWFLIVMFAVAIATVFGWIEPLWFAVMVVLAALGAGAKWSGAI